ncbi:Ig-like domain-containing protein, partial [Blautia ammoniilytica]
YTITASAENYTAEDGSEQAVIKDFVPSQDETKAFTLIQSPEAKAAKWIKDNCDNIFAGCSDAYKAVITKDGDTYTIPYRASDNTIIASGIKLLRPDKSLYQSGWFFSTTECFSRPSKTYSTSATYSFSNVRFISQTDTEMTATLKLYDPATTTSAIKSNTATALASYTYTWIVQPKIEPYSVTLKAKDTDGNLVTDPVYTVTDNYGNVITSSDAAVYQLYADRTYTITASAENYTAEDGSEQAIIKDFVPSQDDCITFTLKNKSVALEDGTYTIDTISDSTMFAFYNTKIIVKDKKAYLVVTLKGTGFDRLYMGDCSESSVKPAEEDTICYAPEQFDGSEHYTFWPVPIVSLNDPLSISGHSARKDTWYHHTITFDQNTLKKISDDCLVPSEKMEAQKLMQQYYIDGNVIAKNKEVCQKSKQTYQIPYYEADGSTPLTEFTLKRPDTARFKSGWKFETTEAANCFTDKTQQGFSTPSVGQNYTLKEQRPTSAATINATLSFYSPTETDAAIDAGTAVVLASTEVTFVIAPKATTYQIKFQAVNSFTQDILPDARITIVDQNGNTLTPGANGTYTLNDATSYTVTASQNGYVGAGGKEEAYLVFVPSKDETVSLPLTRAEDGKCFIKFAYVDENNNSLDLTNVSVTVYDADDHTKTVDPEPDGSYLIWKDRTYHYSINAYGYYKITYQELTVSTDQIITVSLKERIKTYTMTLIAFGYDTGKDLSDATQKVIGEKNGIKTQIDANSDGTYTLDWETMYTVYLSCDNYSDREYSMGAFTENEKQSFTLRLALSPSQKHQLETTIASANDFLATIIESSDPLDWPTGTKDKLQSAIAEANAVLNNDASTDSDYSNTRTSLEKTIREIKKSRNPAQETITIRYQIDRDGPTFQKTLNVSGNQALKAGYTKGNLDNYAKVNVTDALAALHQDLYGTEFVARPYDYLDTMYGMEGLITKVFQNTGSHYTYRINHKNVDFMYTGTTLLSNNDILSIYPSASSTTSQTEEYLYFTQTALTTVVNTPFALTLMGLNKEAAKNVEAYVEEGYTVTLKNAQTNDTLTATSDKNGILTFIPSVAGIYKVEAVSKDGITAVAAPYAEITVNIPEPTAVPVPTVTPEPTATPVPTVTPVPTTPVPTVTPVPTTVTKPVDKQILMLQLKSRKNSMVLKWNKIKGADTYKIYGAKCGNSYKLLKTVSSKNLTWTNRKLKKGTHYKYYIVAISNGQKLATSPHTHAVTKGSSYGYAQKITVNKKTLKLRTGKTKRIKASVTNSSTYVQKHVATVRYLSSDPSIATVSKTGVVRAKKKGNCTIYCYTSNGLFKKVKVTVTK